MIYYLNEFFLCKLLNDKAIVSYLTAKIILESTNECIFVNA